MYEICFVYFIGFNYFHFKNVENAGGPDSTIRWQGELDFASMYDMG